MGSWLEVEGAKAIRKQAQAYVREAVREIKSHITTELEKHMATLNESIDRLTSAITTEIAQVRAEAQANLEAAQAALAEASADNAELTTALQAEVDRNTSLVGTIDSAQGRIDSISSDLEANDPAPPPVEPTPVEPAPVEPDPNA